MLKSKKIIVLLIAMFLLFSICVQIKATSDNPLAIANMTVISGGEDASEANSTYANSEAANAQAANEVASNSQVIQPTTNTNTSTGGNKLPQTGVTEDITVMFFIIVCIISAVYAYKKIRDYNI